MFSKVAVTVCSANFLAYAKGLADSVVKFNPDYKVVIGLVDKLDDNFDFSFYQPHTILQVHEMNIPQFKEMYNRYNLFELNCALKSFFVKWVLNELRPAYVLYLDADMLVFDSFRDIENNLENFSVFITPHIIKPFPDDGKRPRENDILKTGMFNAGFFALKNDETGNQLINWWSERMIDLGYERPKDGLNSDQNWLNFVQLYFEKVQIVKHPGYNAAYWNLHERNITKNENRFFANNEPLVFFHFSGYSIQNPDKISKHQDRVSLKSNAVLAELCSIYHQMLLKNRTETLQKIPCYYMKEKKKGWLKKMGIIK